MVSAFALVLISLLAAICLACFQGGKWRQRARAAEKRKAANVKARRVQDDIAFDPDLRERVRRHFDRP